MFEFISYFYDAYFKIEDAYPENVSGDDVKTILTAYLETYDHKDDQSQWFDKIREIAAAGGYAAKPKDYKKNPELYKGHVGDVSTVIRIALMGRAMSPDIWEIQQILGEEKTKERIKKSIR
jgi:glutamyl-tRNA synthetase